MMEIHCKDCGGKEFARKEEMYICTEAKSLPERKRCTFALAVAESIPHLR